MHHGNDNKPLKRVEHCEIDICSCHFSCRLNLAWFDYDYLLFDQVNQPEKL